MSEHRAEHQITTMCRLLGVSASGYYAWEQREPSARAQANEQLLARMRTIHVKSRETYGAPRMIEELQAEGLRVGHNRVSRLMRQAGLVGASRRKSCWTTRRNKDARALYLLPWPACANCLKNAAARSSISGLLRSSLRVAMVHA